MAVVRVSVPILRKGGRGRCNMGAEKATNAGPGVACATAEIFLARARLDGFLHLSEASRPDRYTYCATCGPFFLGAYSSISFSSLVLY